MNLVANHLLGRFVGLEPLEERHHQQMAKASIDPRIWRNTPLGGSFDEYFDSLGKLRDTGRQMPFAVRWLETNEIIGGTRFLGDNSDPSS